MKELIELKTVLDELAIDHWLDGETLRSLLKRRITSTKAIELGAFHEHFFDSFDEVKERINGFEIETSGERLVFKKNKKTITILLYYVVEDGNETSGYFRSATKSNEGFLFLLNSISAFALDVKKKTPVNILKNILKSFFMHMKPFYMSFIEFGISIGTVRYYELFYPRMFFEFFKTVRFNGIDIPIPLQTEQYLEFCYGKNWKTMPLDCAETIDSKKGELLRI